MSAASVVCLFTLISLGAAISAASPPDEPPPAAWPGSQAPALDILRCCVWHETDDLGIEEETVEEALLLELAKRPDEFALAIEDSAPPGHLVSRALLDINDGQVDEALSLEVFEAVDRWAEMAQNLALLLPPEQAGVALTGLHRRSAIMECWMSSNLHGQVRAEMMGGDTEDEAVAKRIHYRRLADQYGGYCADAERIARELGATIDPVTSRWPPRIDLAKRNAVMRKYGSLGRRAGPVGITVNDFFDGNGSHDSIAVNLWVNHPGVETIRRALEDTLAKPGVLDVRISVHEWPNSRNPNDDGMWIAADSVHVWTRDVSQEEMNAWLAPLRAHWVSPVPKDWPVPVNDTPQGEGIVVYTAGWD